MSPLLRAVGFLFAAVSVACAGEFRVVAHYHIGGEVRYDYLRADPEGRRLYVSHGTQVEVLDLDSGKKLGSVGPMKGIHGIALVPGLERGFISAGGDHAVVMFDLETLKIIQVIGGLAGKPDSIQYDPLTRMIYAASGSSGGITVIDPSKGEVSATIPMEGSLEEFVFDGKGRLYANTEDRSMIQVVDTRTLKQVASWPIAPVEGGTGLAIDVAHHRLYSAGGNGMLAVVDSDTGALVATPAIGESPDGALFDPVSGLIATPSMQGTLTLLHEDSPDRYSLVQTVTTAPGARTIAADPKTGRYFMPTGQFLPADPPTAVNPHPRRKGVPDTFEVLVVGG